MPFATISLDSSAGIKSAQDLYDLINGKATTQSATTSQEGMNAMLKSVLEGNQGLAAVSSGQRAAGGYGSSTNTLLTNDLMARAAGQIAASNQTKTTTTGGLTNNGVGKLGSLLGVAGEGVKLKGAWDKYVGSNPDFGMGSTGATIAANGVGTDSLAQGFPQFDVATDAASGGIDAASALADTASYTGSLVESAASTVADGGTSWLDGLFGFADGGPVNQDELLRKRNLNSGQREPGVSDSIDAGGFGGGTGGTGSTAGSIGVDGQGNSAVGANATGAQLGANVAAAGKGLTTASKVIINTVLSALNPALGLAAVANNLGVASGIGGIGLSPTGGFSVTTSSIGSTPGTTTTNGVISDAPTEADDSSGGDAGVVGGGVNGDAGVSGSGDAGANGDGTSAADGGPISGPGSSVSDSINAKLSDGEFVLSADVVAAIGKDKLQALQEKYHVPAATQKLMAFGKGRG